MSGFALFAEADAAGAAIEDFDDDNGIFLVGIAERMFATHDFGIGSVARESWQAGGVIRRRPLRSRMIAAVLRAIIRSSPVPHTARRRRRISSKLSGGGMAWLASTSAERMKRASEVRWPPVRMRSLHSTGGVSSSRDDQHCPQCGRLVGWQCAAWKPRPRKMTP